MLADKLADVLSVAPKDPMAREFVAVPSAGMRTWLSLELAKRLGAGIGDDGEALADGVSANIDFAFPGTLRLRVLEADGSVARDSDPWDLTRLPWSILEVADSPAGNPAPAGLPPALLESPVGGSRYGAARAVADLFDRYHLHRPAMVQAWAAGHNHDGIGKPLPDRHVWQPELWRAVRDLVDVPSPPERMDTVLPRLRNGELDVDLPDRVCVFGMSLLPGGPGFIDLANALGHLREVHLFVVEPSPVLAGRFEAVAADSHTAATTANTTGHRLRSEVDPAALKHPLLRSWGRLHYETASVLADARSDGRIPTGEDAEPAAQSSEQSLLGLLQSQIRADGASVGDLEAAHPALEMPDGRPRSIEFHACYGDARQVEVMRDTVLRLLDDDPGMQEDDVLVVCPDLERFAPLIEATLGPSASTGELVAEAGDLPALRYRLADRSLGSSVALVGAFQALLELVTGRFDAPAVLDFLALDPVRQRFGFDDDALATITQWVLDVNIRWGLDPGSREADGVPATITTNTWQAGMDRLLLGAAVNDPSQAGSGDAILTDTVGDVIPHGVEGSDVRVAGRLSDALWRLGHLATEVAVDRPVSEWVELFRGVVADVFSVSREQGWQLDRLSRSLGAMVDSSVRDRGAGESPAGTSLGFADFRGLVDDHLADIEGRPSFMRGGVTISSLTPLRWVPHKVIVMVGMDAELLGSGTADGDDLAAVEPLVGDRDRRGELRQSMLETVLSAGEQLVVIRNGHDVRTNQMVPMPVAVAELRDAVLAMVAPNDRDGVAKALEVAHPRQPFDEAYFGGATGHGGEPSPPARSFDPAALRGAQARRGRADQLAAFLDEPLDPLELAEVSLADLLRFLRCPVQHFVERRLDVRFPREADSPAGILAANLEPLEVYSLGDDLLTLLCTAAGVDDAVRVWNQLNARTGAVPAARIGAHEQRRIELQVRDLHAQCEDAGVSFIDPGSTVAIDVAAGDGTRVVGSVQTRLDTSGGAADGPALVRFVKRRPEHGLAVWLELAALTLMHPERPWRGVVGTRASSGQRSVDGLRIGKVQVTGHALTSADPASAAQMALDTVVDLYRRGMCEPLPLLRKLSEQVFANPDSRLEWPDEHANEAEMLVYGGHSASGLRQLDVLDRDPAGSATDRLGLYAEYLFGTLAATTADPVGSSRSGAGS